MEAVKAFNDELSGIYETNPPISRAKMTQLTKKAIKGIKFYKHIVQSIEKFIQKCRPEYKVPGLYVIDSVVRQSRHQFGPDKDVFMPRICKNILTTFQHIYKCPAEDKPRILRVLNLWQKNSIFPQDVVQQLMIMGGAPAQPTSEPAVKQQAPPQQQQQPPVADAGNLTTVLTHLLTNPDASQIQSLAGLLSSSQQTQLEELLKQVKGPEQGPPSITAVDNYNPASAHQQQSAQHQQQLHQQQMLEKQKQQQQQMLEQQQKLQQQQLMEQQQKLQQQQMLEQQQKMQQQQMLEQQQKMQQQQMLEQQQRMQQQMQQQRKLQQQQMQQQQQKPPNRVFQPPERPADFPPFLQSQNAEVEQKRQPSFNREVLDFDYSDDEQTPPAANRSFNQNSLSNDANREHARDQQVRDLPRDQHAPQQMPQQPDSAETERLRRLEEEQEIFNKQIQQMNYNENPEQQQREMSQVSTDSRRRKRSRSRSKSHDRKHRHRRHRSRSGEKKRSRRSRSRDRSSRRSRRSGSRSRAEKPRHRERAKGMPPIKDGCISVCSTTVWIGNLSSKVVQSEIQRLIDEIELAGKIESINMIPPRGCAYICMENRLDANKTIKQLRHAKLSGKSLKCDWAPGKEMPDAYKSSWEKEYGVNYVPMSADDIPSQLQQLSMWGFVDPESVPADQRAALEEVKQQEAKEVKIPSPADIPLPPTAMRDINAPRPAFVNNFTPAMSHQMPSGLIRPSMQPLPLPGPMRMEIRPPVSVQQKNEHPVSSPEPMDMGNMTPTKDESADEQKPAAQMQVTSQPQQLQPQPTLTHFGPVSVAQPFSGPMPVQMIRMPGGMAQQVMQPHMGVMPIRMGIPMQMRPGFHPAMAARMQVPGGPPQMIPNHMHPMHQQPPMQHGGFPMRMPMGGPGMHGPHPLNNMPGPPRPPMMGPDHEADRIPPRHLEPDHRGPQRPDFGGPPHTQGPPHDHRGPPPDHRGPPIDHIRPSHDEKPQSPTRTRVSPPSTSKEETDRPAQRPDNDTNSRGGSPSSRGESHERRENSHDRSSRRDGGARDFGRERRSREPEKDRSERSQERGVVGRGGFRDGPPGRPWHGGPPEGPPFRGPPDERSFRGGFRDGGRGGFGRGPMDRRSPDDDRRRPSRGDDRRGRPPSPFGGRRDDDDATRRRREWLANQHSGERGGGPPTRAESPPQVDFYSSQRDLIRQLMEQAQAGGEPKTLPTPSNSQKDEQGSGDNKRDGFLQQPHNHGPTNTQNDDPARPQGGGSARPSMDGSERLPKGQPDRTPRGGPDRQSRWGPEKPSMDGPDRPPRDGPDRPPRDGPDRPPRDGPDRPLRDGPDRPPRDGPDGPPRDGPDRPPRDGPDRPPRDGPDRPPRDGPDRPPRDGPDRPPRDGPDRPPRDGPDRPPRDGPDRPPRDGPDRPPRNFSERGQRGDRERPQRDGRFGRDGPGRPTRDGVGGELKESPLEGFYSSQRDLIRQLMEQAQAGTVPEPLPPPPTRHLPTARKEEKKPSNDCQQQQENNSSDKTTNLQDTADDSPPVVETKQQEISPVKNQEEQQEKEHVETQESAEAVTSQIPAEPQVDNTDYDEPAEEVEESVFLMDEEELAQERVIKDADNGMEVDGDIDDLANDTEQRPHSADVDVAKDDPDIKEDVAYTTKDVAEFTEDVTFITKDQTDGSDDGDCAEDFTADVDGTDVSEDVTGITQHVSDTEADAVNDLNAEEEDGAGRRSPQPGYDAVGDSDDQKANIDADMEQDFDVTDVESGDMIKTNPQESAAVVSERESEGRDFDNETNDMDDPTEDAGNVTEDVQNVTENTGVATEDTGVAEEICDMAEGTGDVLEAADDVTEDAADSTEDVDGVTKNVSGMECGNDATNHETEIADSLLQPHDVADPVDVTANIEADMDQQNLDFVNTESDDMTELDPQQGSDVEKAEVNEKSGGMKAKRGKSRRRSSRRR